MCFGNTWMMCEARSWQFEVWQEKTKLFTERSEPVMLITCWYLCFPVSRALWFAMPLFGKLPLGIISFDCLYDSFTRALPLISLPILSAFTLIPSTISRLWNQSCCARRWYADVVLTILHFFIVCDRSVQDYTSETCYLCTVRWMLRSGSRVVARATFVHWKMYGQGCH